MEIEIITHFCANDPKFQGDYHSREVRVNNEVAYTLSDAYHSSRESAQSFVDGVIFAMRSYSPDAGQLPVSIAHTDVADIPNCEWLSLHCCSHQSVL